MVRILIADDEADFRAMLRAGLEAAGHQVEEVEDGDGALRVVGRGAADLVFCDLFMPGKDGLETIRELRLLAPGVPVIAISGGGHCGLVDLLPVAQSLGAAAVLHKPFDMPAALAAVAQALATSPSGQTP
jgi:two-component system, chemotaxis family, chemotaxis protein CheY